MQKKRLIYFIFILFISCSEQSKKDEPLKNRNEIALGKLLFFDPMLSKNRNQSCSTCHNPDYAFVDNRKNSVYGASSLGDDLISLGTRNTPTIAYAMFSPKFHYNKIKKQYIGGFFWDGREPDLKSQAAAPLLNPIEMSMPNKEVIVKRLKKSPIYNKHFKEVYGKNIFEDPTKTYFKMAQAIAAFEKTSEFAPFDSKYDRYLRGDYDLTQIEELGRSLFFDKKKTNCTSCHMSKKENAERETFTNYEYHNIGVPRNPELLAKNIADPKTFIDYGLMHNPKIKQLKNASDYAGKMKVPTLRNVAVTAPYMHNGVFKKLSTVILFYDKYNHKEREINLETGLKWRKPEVKINKEDHKILSKGELLTQDKIDALIAFLKLLTDKRYEHLIPQD